jgi:hypothetical protein
VYANLLLFDKNRAICVRMVDKNRAICVRIFDKNRAICVRHPLKLRHNTLYRGTAHQQITTNNALFLDHAFIGITMKK